MDSVGVLKSDIGVTASTPVAAFWVPNDCASAAGDHVTGARRLHARG